MKDTRNRDRITLSMPQATNALLEELQHRLRKTGSRHYKSRILHEAIEYFAEGLGLQVGEDAAGGPRDEPVGVEEVSGEKEGNDDGGVE